MIKVDKEMCDLANNLLNREMKRQGDDTWIKSLVKLTSEHSTSTASLVRFVGGNMGMFRSAAIAMLPKYLRKHPSLNRFQAQEMLELQLVVRLILYVVDRAYGQKELIEQFKVEEE